MGGAVASSLNSGPRRVAVLLPYPLGPYDYSVPSEMELSVGDYVVVPLGPREILGVVWGEGHLRRILRAYARFYNDIRTHRSLDNDAPVSRPAQRIGCINSRAILGGLHHHYLRV